MHLTCILVLLLIQSLLVICAIVDIIPPKVDPDIVPPKTDPGLGGDGSGSGTLGTEGGSSGTEGGSSGTEGGSSIGGLTSGVDGTPSTGSTAEPDNVEDIGEALSSVVDAITSLLSDLSPSSSIDTSGISLLTPTATIDESTITPAIAVPTAALACFNASSIYNSCSAQVSGFLSAAESAQADCLCYQTLGSSTSWLPFLSDCNQYVQTASNDSAVISGISEGAALCSSAQVAKTAMTAVATSIPPITSSSMANQQLELLPSFMVLGTLLSYWAAT